MGVLLERGESGGQEILPGHTMRNRPLFWIGLGLILAAVLVYVAMVISWELHKKDDTGSSGGFAGIEIFIFPPLAGVIFIILGVYCMVCMKNVYCLVPLAIFNILSAWLHIHVAWKATGWQTPEPGASEAITRKVDTAWIRILPEALGIVLSIAAVCAAIYEVIQILRPDTETSVIKQDNGKEAML